jgi:hypothetical protein
MPIVTFDNQADEPLTLVDRLQLRNTSQIRYVLLETVKMSPAETD